MERVNNSVVFAKKSVFKGSTFGYFGIIFVSYFLTLITLGILYPFVMSWRLSWISRKTIIDNKRLEFDGNGLQLFGKYIIWLLLSILTLGLYYIFVMRLNLERWRVKHTHIVGIEAKESKFTGSALGLLGVNIISYLITIVTLGLGYFWAHCYKESWYASHTYYDGYQLAFDGKALEFFGKYILWLILTFITFGIYAFFLIIKSYKWSIKHTSMPSYPIEVSVLLKSGDVVYIDNRTNLNLAYNPEYNNVDNKLKELEKEKKSLLNDISPSKIPYVLYLISTIFILVTSFLLSITLRVYVNRFVFVQFIVISSVLLGVSFRYKPLNISKDGILKNNKVFSISRIIALIYGLILIGSIVLFRAISNDLVIAIISISMLSIGSLLLILGLVYFVKNLNERNEKSQYLEENKEIFMNIERIQNDINNTLLIPEYLEIS